MEILWIFVTLPILVALLETKSRENKRTSELRRIYEEGRLSERDAVALGMKEAASQASEMMETQSKNEIKSADTLQHESKQDAKTFVAKSAANSGDTETASPTQTQLPQKHHFSVISLLLAVGVALIFGVGVMLIGSIRSSLSVGGWLAALCAGSALLFGASAMARKRWHLQRTGEAFFLFGTSFLTLSIWATGALGMFGNGLSGYHNPWMLALAAAILTAVSCLALQLYRDIGWSISALCGFCMTYVCFCKAVCPNNGMFCLAIGVYAAAVACFIEPLKRKFPLLFEKSGDIYALYVTFVGCVLLMLHASEHSPLIGVGALCLAAAFLSPTVSRRLNGWTALPVAILILSGFGMVCYHLMVSEWGWKTDPFKTLLCMMTAAVLLLILFSERYFSKAEGGFLAAFCVMVGVTQFYLIGGFVLNTIADESLVMVGAVALLLMTAVAAISLGNRCFFGSLAVESVVVLCCLAELLFSVEETIVIAAMIAVAVCGMVFTFIKPLRTRVSDFFFPLMAFYGGYAGAYTWGDEGIFASTLFCVMILASGIVFWLFAIENRTNHVRQYVQGIFGGAMIVMSFPALAECSLIGELDDVNGIIGTLYMAIFALLIVLTIRQSQNQFTPLRKLLIILYCLPFLLLCQMLLDDYCIWTILGFLVVAAAAAYLWRLCVKWKHPRCSVFSFIVMLAMLFVTIMLIRTEGEWRLYDSITL